MKKTGIPLKGVKLTASGKIEKAHAYRDVSHQIRARKSKKVRVKKSMGGT